MIALDAVGFLLADEETPRGDQLGIGRPAIGAVQARVKSLQPVQQALTSGAITIPALPVNQSARSTIPSLPDPELVRLFLR